MASHMLEPAYLRQRSYSQVLEGDFSTLGFAAAQFIVALWIHGLLHETYARFSQEAAQE